MAPQYVFTYTRASRGTKNVMPVTHNIYYAMQARSAMGLTLNSVHKHRINNILTYSGSGMV